MAAWDWGPMLAARHLWCELGLEVTLDRLVDGQRRDAATLSDRAPILLTAPGSEHGLARWLETEFVCDRDSRRFLPAWRDDAARKATRTQRVRVEARQNTARSIKLLALKAQIEYALFVTLRGLFSLRVKSVLRTECTVTVTPSPYLHSLSP